MGQTLFVSSKGDDRNPGTEEQPLATLKRAQEVVRACKQNGPITVCLRQGTYYLNETLIFGAEDSGTKDAPIVYRAYEDEEVVVRWFAVAIQMLIREMGFLMAAFDGFRQRPLKMPLIRRA